MRIIWLPAKQGEFGVPLDVDEHLMIAVYPDDMYGPKLKAIITPLGWPKTCTGSMRWFNTHEVAKAKAWCEAELQMRALDAIS